MTTWIGVGVVVFEDLVASIRGCRACAHLLPVEPRPVIQVSPQARLLIASQAPGSKVHASGIPFSDPSGDRLRDWMGVTSKTFYDASRVAIVPVGFCYPGRARSGDAAPRPECARLWRKGLLTQMPRIKLTLLVGTYAQENALGAGRMTERVRRFREFLPKYFPLPHPSWRSRMWASANPWFELEVLPELRRRVQDVLEQ
nr:uracil-DNA glycosylase family protein [Sphingobium vermicomposti]